MLDMAETLVLKDLSDEDLAARAAELSASRAAVHEKARVLNDEYNAVNADLALVERERDKRKAIANIRRRIEAVPAEDRAEVVEAVLAEKT